jgi:large subunit ribosomal protein L10
MPKQNKIDAVAKITADLKAAEVYYFVEYRGLTFAETTDLRARLRKVDADLKVVKNTLGKIAAANAGVEGLDELLAGPTAIAYVHGDPAKTAKTIQDFIKEKKKPVVVIRGGKLQNSVLSAQQVEALASLPSREVLIAQVVRAIASPLQGLANVLNGPIRGLVVVLAQVQEKQNAA